MRAFWILSAALVLCVASAVRAEAPSRLCGRVFERGASTIVTSAMITIGDSEPIAVGDDGRFCADVPAGVSSIAITADGYDPLHGSEELPPGIRRTVEYRLTPTPSKSRFRSVVKGSAFHEGDRISLRDEELKQLPGTGGDPFRVVGLLPGVLAPIPILPIYVIRGGSPGMNGFFLDGMRVPGLFHLVFNEGVVHPEIVDHLEFYPGGFDTTFGRVGSGVIDAYTRPARTDAPAHGDFGLKLYDTSALLEAKIPGGASVLAAGRYGFPSLIFHIVQPGVNLSYWDYQFRLDWKGLTVEALGSFDSLSIDPSVFGGGGSPIAAQLLVEFHRIQIREQLRRGRLELEAALVGGLDRMAVLSGQGVQKLSLNGRVRARYKIWWLTLAAGGEVEISRFNADQFVTDDTRAAPDALGDLAGDRNGVVGGAYAQATLALDRVLHRPASITFGVRADVYHAGDVTLLGVDPRVLARYQPTKFLELFGAFGQYTQAPSFPIPLPGIDTFALQLGLQKNVQGSLGMRLYLPADINVSVTGYYGHFTNINDVLLDFETTQCQSPPPESLKGIASYTTRVLDGSGYGMELMARRTKGRVTGWISYTLSRSERIFSCGLGPSDFDQSHVLNAIVQVRLPWRLMLGFHLNLQTGRPYTQLSVDASSGAVSGHRNNERLPLYFQLDLRLDREWLFKKWAFALFVEILNVAYSETIYGVSYPKDPILMVTRYDQPQFEGFRWILPSIGIRARF